MKSKRKPTGLQLVADAIGVRANTLRARLAYHKISTRGKSATAVASAMQSKLGHPFTPAQQRKLTGKNAPPVIPNPKPAAPSSVVDVRSKNLKIAILALRDVEAMITPLEAGRYGLRELRELEALELLVALDKP